MENIKLNFAHICENAFLSEDGKVNIIGDFDKISANTISLTSPLILPFFVVTNFTIEPKQKYIQEVLLIDSQNDKVIASRKIEQDASENKIGLIVKFNTTFTSPGLYKVVIKLDSKTYDELGLVLSEVVASGK